MVTALPGEYSYYIEDTIITLEKTGDSLLLGNQYGQSATLMVALDPNSDGFKYRNRFFDETSNLLDIELIEFSFDSTGFPYKIRGVSMRFKSYRIKRVLSGYILITTSGVMFFIITAVTILHLMSAKTLTKEYRLHDAYQDMLNQQGIRQILAMQISNNESTLRLPDSLDSMYGVTHAQLANGSVDFLSKIVILVG